ncbi:hypothetical protein EC973_001105 [Apophysomyces ossiformis]|uniref:Rhodanese domain-containing protein n=1 Tax=Apophysomyces ossiformis TaxID=679940 RepID=A0A8H7BU94_9FUNG|nr:hypothetical protein EC973_001105 [Apophysomyces ossiformis]
MLRHIQYVLRIWPPRSVVYRPTPVISACQPTISAMGNRMTIPWIVRMSSTSSMPRSLPSSSYKTLAFYKFHPLPEDQLPVLRERILADLSQWQIVGRIYISKEGFNAQLSCPEHNLEQLAAYCEKTLKPLLGGSLMDFNFGTEHGKRAFRALHVRIRKQLVADGLDPRSYDLTNQPSHLSPSAWHEKLKNYKQKHGKDPVLIDMRNHYESEIGYFKGAVKPNVDTFRGSIKAMNDICKDLPRDQEVFMYCTGGIRCSKAGAILQSASGFKTVHLVAGGITAYGQWIKESNQASLFRGHNFTFDARLGEPITDEKLGHCHLCGEPCNRYQNCAHSACNLLMICCASCAAQFHSTCGRIKCYDVVHGYTTKTKTHFQSDGPVMIDGVRAFMKQGQQDVDADRIVVGKSGEECEHEHHKRIRAVDVLGEPGDILKEWAKAGRELPPKP